MQRQADNRHHLVAQAMAFLTRYRELRGEEPDGIGEVEFNFGRAFHQLGKGDDSLLPVAYFKCTFKGLHSHAVKHYEKVLELGEKAESIVRLTRK